MGDVLEGMASEQSAPPAPPALPPLVRLSLDAGVQPQSDEVIQLRAFVQALNALVAARNARAAQSLLSTVVGQQMAQVILEIGVLLVVDEDHTLHLGYKSEEHVRLELVFTPSFLARCQEYFATYRLEDPSQAVAVFYDSPALEGVVHPYLLGACATDVFRMEGGPDPNELSQDYLSEFCGAPWYFRSFLQAFDAVWQVWRPEEMIKLTYMNLAEIAFPKFGWANLDDIARDGPAAYNLAMNFVPDVTDIAELRMRLVYSKVRVVYTKNATEYHSHFDRITKGEWPADSSLNACPTDQGAWVVYFDRKEEEWKRLGETLEAKWKAYVDCCLKRDEVTALVALVDLVQTSNTNHYFFDGNGRFTMLLIQLHMRASSRGQLLAFYDHNPNGPCPTKYLDMLTRAPRLSATEPLLDRAKIKEAYEEAMGSTCAPFTAWDEYDCALDCRTRKRTRSEEGAPDLANPPPSEEGGS